MSLPKNNDRSKSNLQLAPADSHDQIAATRCAIITGAGRSAIGVISIRGSMAGNIVSQCFEGATKGRFSQGQIRYGLWWTTAPSGDGRRDDHAGESVVITPIDDDHFEIHCHGGPAAIRRIVDDLQACGAEMTDPHAWTPSEKLLIHEASQVLCRCLTARTAAIAMDQVRGAMFRWASNHLAGLDDQRTTIEEIQRQAQIVLRVADFTTRLAEPFRVVLLGPPNVGKSSLLNAIVGFDRSITLDAPGTTRDLLHAETVVDGVPIRLSDTAGIRDSNESIEKQGVERARLAASDADLVLSVTEPSRGGCPQGTGQGTIRVLNKSDLLESGDDSPTYDVATSALTGDGIEPLMDLIAKKLTGDTEKEGRMPRPGDPVAINQRQAVLMRQIAAARDACEMAAHLRHLLGVGDATGKPL